MSGFSGGSGGGGGGESALPGGGTNGDHLQYLNGEGTWGEHRAYLNIMMEWEDIALTEAGALALAANIPNTFIAYMFDGTSYFLVHGGSPDGGATPGTGSLAARQPFIADIFFSHQYVTIIDDGDGNPAFNSSDQRPRLWYVGGDAGPVQPHWVKMGGQTFNITDNAAIEEGDVLFVDATGGNITISLGRSGSELPVSGTEVFRIIRTDSAVLNTVTIIETIDGVVNPTVGVGESWYVVADADLDLHRVAFS